MWFVQPKEEETEGRLHGGLQLPHKGSGGSGTDPLSSGDSNRTWGNGMELCQGKKFDKTERTYVTTRNIITYQMHQSSNNLHFLRS